MSNESESQIPPGNQFGLHCPRCNADDRILVVAQAWVRLVPNGTDPTGYQQWDDASTACCDSCRWTGPVGQLIDKSVENPFHIIEGVLDMLEDKERNPPKGAKQ